jgi:AraC-like DNA-binding protein
VLRFRRALAIIAANREISWTDLAIEAGYYDQAHLINEFQEFCGSTPEEYRGSVNTAP